MDTKHVLDRIRMFDIHQALRGRASSLTAPVSPRFALALACCLGTAVCVCPSAAAAETGGSTCFTDYDSEGWYPSLAESIGPDLIGEAAVVLYLDLDRAIVEIDACLYTVDRAVELDFGELDVMVAYLELPASTSGWTLFVTRDGVWTETVETASSSMSVMLWPDERVELEFAPPGQPRPVKPLVVLGPHGENPAP